MYNRYRFGAGGVAHNMDYFSVYYFTKASSFVS